MLLIQIMCCTISVIVTIRCLIKRYKSDKIGIIKNNYDLIIIFLFLTIILLKSAK